MRKEIIIIVLLITGMFLISCKGRPTKISDANEFEQKFTGAIKYDIRDENICEEGHIPGFMCMGSKEKDTLIKNIDLVAYDYNQVIILIGSEEDVLYIFNALGKEGYKNMFYFDGGYEGYVAVKGEEFVPETGCGC